MRRFLIVLMAFLTACSSIPGIVPVEDSQLIRADVQRSNAPDLGEQQVSNLVNGNNSFAFDLYHQAAAASSENLIFSPYSISLAFSMVYAGARGDTEAEMADVLHFQPQDSQHSAFNALDLYFENLGKEDVSAQNREEQGDPFQLNIANAVWGQEGYPFLDEFLEILAAEYGAGLRTADFVNNSNAEREEINNWIEEETEDRIKDMIPPEGVITPATRMVLVNAIYFKAGWLMEFSESATLETPFKLLDGGTVNAEMMRNSELKVNYLQGDGFQAAVLPYVGNQTGMLIILPEEGRYSEIESALSPEILQSVLESSAYESIIFAMPKIDFETDLDLIELLKPMGLQKPFSGEADFSGIAGNRDLFISAALHKANITVDEEGTEAAAATVIAVAESAMEIREPIEMIVDRPYIFAIIDQGTGSILFLGRTLNPAQ